MDTLPIGITKLPSTKRRNQYSKSCNTQLYRIKITKTRVKKRKIEEIKGYQNETEESNNQQPAT